MEKYFNVTLTVEQYSTILTSLMMEFAERDDDEIRELITSALRVMYTAKITIK